MKRWRLFHPKPIQYCKCSNLMDIAPSILVCPEHGTQAEPIIDLLNRITADGWVVHTIHNPKRFGGVADVYAYRDDE